MSPKVLKFTLQRILNFFVNGRSCVLCMTCSTFITIFLCFKMELNLNYGSKSSTILHNNLVNKNQIYYVTTSSRKVTKSLSEMMKTVPEINEDIVFFNSIPKSGGELLILLLQWLQNSNGFKHVRLPFVREYKLTRYDQDHIVQTVLSEVRNGALPFTFDQQMHFINFTSFGNQIPMYLSLVRDPIDRAIIKFHSNQATPTLPVYYQSKNKSKRKIRLYKYVIKEFEKCVLRKEDSCNYNNGKGYESIIPYFCGYDDQCWLHNDRWALNHAKHNIDKYYPVVGLLENVNATLYVLQRQLPYFFKNVVDVYNKQLSKNHETNELYRPVKSLDNTVKKILEKQLENEYDLYHYIKKRLLSQLI